MVRDGVDAISGSFESPRWLHTVSHSGAVVSDSTPLRPRALPASSAAARGRRSAFSRYRGAPRPGAGPATKLTLLRTRSRRWAIGYVITYRQFTDYTYFIYT